MKKDLVSRFFLDSRVVPSLLLWGVGMGGDILRKICSSKLERGACGEFFTAEPAGETPKASLTQVL